MSKGDVHAWVETGELRRPSMHDWWLDGECTSYGMDPDEHKDRILRKLDPADVIVARGGIEGAEMRLRSLICDVVLAASDGKDWGIEATKLRAAILGPEEPEVPEWAVGAAEEWAAMGECHCDDVGFLATLIAKHHREANGGEA